MKKIYSIILLSLSIASAFLVSCSTERVTENSPANILLKSAEDDIASKRYLQAIDRLKLIRNKHPYSKEAIEAKLRLSDVYFLQESWTEASASYDGFVELHPKHEKVSYALFRSAESYYNDMPGSYDKDLTPAQNAIEKYSLVISKYPKSEFVATSDLRIKECKNMLAQREEYIADYYFKKENWKSAAGRYKEILELYPSFERADKALYRTILSLKKAEAIDEAKKIAEKYSAKYKDSKMHSDISELTQKL